MFSVNFINFCHFLNNQKLFNNWKKILNLFTYNGKNILEYCHFKVAAQNYESSRSVDL